MVLPEVSVSVSVSFRFSFFVFSLYIVESVVVSSFLDSCVWVGLVRL
eukprot:COSAG06_NODE_46987_length_342_cov_1.485597_1_plen_46_part_10